MRGIFSSQEKNILEHILTRAQLPSVLTLFVLFIRFMETLPPKTQGAEPRTFIYRT